ncbi:hypothetical protein C8J57DRAFT_1220125 [Mycena rebaudengoi]|nr:hypothetical protein C8J57DRAFT_1220125 [Mycena rebaudengoi]
MKHMPPHIPQHIPLRLAPRPQAVLLQHALPRTAYRVEHEPHPARLALSWTAALLRELSLGMAHAKRGLNELSLNLMDLVLKMVVVLLCLSFTRKMRRPNVLPVEWAAECSRAESAHYI